MYLNQAVPSPVGMPAYERSFPHSNVVKDPSLASLDQIETLPLVDSTGRRVAAYMQHLRVNQEFVAMSYYLSSPRAYAFRPQAYNNLPTRSRIIKSLHPIRGRTKLLGLARTFQRRAVLNYRGLRPKAHLLALPILNDDETTTAGMFNVIIKFLRQVKLLVPGKITNGPDWVCPNDSKTIWLLLVGDGLSAEQYRAFENSLREHPTFAATYESVSEILKSLQQVVFLPGDLHGACFHTLGPLYTIFHGGFLQIFQTALGWKRLDANKVENTYEQAAFLALLVLTECERQLYDAFVSQLPDNVVNSWGALFANPSLLASTLANCFLQWFDNKLTSSTDEVFCMGIHYVKLARQYRQFRRSIHHGDSIAMECLYNSFTAVWYALGKSKYTEIGLGLMEDFYGTIPYWLLQVVRDNRFARVHDNRPDGSECAEWALDAMIESLQQHYKSMSFKNDTASWIKHSRNMPMVNRCVMHVDNEYSRRYGVESLDEYNKDNPCGAATNKGKKKNLSIPPKRDSEKNMIAEILCKGSVFVEQPGRKMTLDSLWSVLPRLTTTLIKTTPEDDIETQSDDVDMELPEEVMLSRMSERVMGDRIYGSIGNACVVDNVDQLEDDDLDAKGDDNNNANQTTGQVASSETPRTITIGTGSNSRKVLRVVRRHLHELASKDAFLAGEIKMRDKDIPALRKRRHVRQKREHTALHEDLYKFLQQLGNDFHGVMSNIDRMHSLPMKHRHTMAAELRNYN